MLGVCSKAGILCYSSEVGLFNGSKYIYRCQPNSLFFFLPYGMVVVHFFSIEFEVNSFTQGVSLSLSFPLSFFPPHEAVGLGNTSPNEKQKELKYLNHWHWANVLFLLSMYESIFLRIHKGEVGRFFIMSLWWHPRLGFLALVTAKDEVAGKGQFSYMAFLSFHSFLGCTKAVFSHYWILWTYRHLKHIHICNSIIKS